MRRGRIPFLVGAFVLVAFGCGVGIVGTPAPVDDEPDASTPIELPATDASPSDDGSDLPDDAETDASDASTPDADADADAAPSDGGPLGACDEPSDCSGFNSKCCLDSSGSAACSSLACPLATVALCKTSNDCAGKPCYLWQCHGRQIGTCESAPPAGACN